jgi:hypothetical protein
MGVLQNVESGAESVVDFLKAHTSLLGTLGAGLAAIVPHLPINQQDKDHILGIAGQVAGSVGAITTALEGVASPAGNGPAIVRLSDVETAVNSVLPAMVAAEVAKELAARPA